MRVLARLKERWNLRSLWQVIAVLVTFSLAGASVVWFRRGVFFLLGFDSHTALWIKIISYILLVFPMYQVLLLVYGWILGQGGFFWEKERKLLQFIRSGFRGRRHNA